MADSEFDDDNTRTHLVLARGTMVQHYRIVEKIGAGGMGEVYLAEDTQLGRKVALKFLPSHLAIDNIARARFTREAKAAAKLDHPNIVPVYEVGEFQGRPFFAMAHIEGKSLREVIKDGKLSVSEAIDHTMQICEGLHEAHSEGVVHRDIKPANIIIDKKNKPRLLDFGLATVTGEEKLTKTGSTLGTVGYMSPEQITGKNIDHRSDLFSVGVILYEMLAGHRPYLGDNDSATMYSITHDNPKPLARFNRDVSEELQQIVDKALVKDASLRYQHADGMIADLKRLRAQSAPIKKRKIGLWAAVAVVVLAIGYFLVDSTQVGRKLGLVQDADSRWTNSIAVLPFRDFSKNKDQEYFCNGMTDAVIGKLSGIENLKVISMTSVLRFKDSDKDLKTIGRELGVSTILEGSIQREDGEIRLQAQLINVSDDAHIWSKTYNRELESMFEIQDDISRAIVEAMRIQLFGEDTTTILRRYTNNIEAFNYYSRGRHLWNKRIESDLRKSIEYFEKAIELDPYYALAYSGLADAWTVILDYIDVPGEIDRSAALRKAREAARMALGLDEGLAEAHASMGLIFYNENENESAERKFLKAVELNPGYHWAHMWYTLLLERMARYQDRIKEEEIAFQLNPMSIPLITNRALAKWRSLELEEAEMLYRRIIEIEPNRMWTYTSLSNLLANMGRNDEAIIQSEKAIEVDLNAYNNLAYIYSQIGDFDQALWAANQYVEFAQDKYDAYDTRADIFAMNGMLDSAIVSFSKALELKPDYALSIWKMGNVYMFMQAYDKADSLYRIVASNSNKYWRATGRFWLAALPLHQGKFKLALELLNKLKDEAIIDSINNDRLADGIFKRATTFQEFLGMHDSAIAEHEKVIRLVKDIAPNSGVVHSSRARIGYSHALRGNFDKADQFIQEIEANFDNFGPNANEFYWFHSGRVELEKGNFDSAIANLERLLIINPNHHNRQILARCYLRAGRLDDVIVLYEKIINRYDPRNRAGWPAWSVTTHYYLGQTYEEAGRYDDAIAQYETFLDIWRNADEGIKMIEDAKERLARLKRKS